MELMTIEQTHKLQKNYLKSTSKPSYMSQKIFDNDLVAISKSKLILNFNKACWDVYIRLRKY